MNLHYICDFFQVITLNDKQFCDENMKLNKYENYINTKEASLFMVLINDISKEFK